jgi:adenylyltransferase/sulfurtransferase
MQEITVQELKRMIDEGQDFQLIDVREQHEVEICTLDGEHIPMGEIINRRNEVAQDKPVIVHCRSGARSANVIKALEGNFGLKGLKNLKGGILAWANEIDPDMPTY